MAVSDYSTTAASNTSISGVDISGATGKVKDGDNAIRQIMADIKAGVPYLTGTTLGLPSGTTAVSYSGATVTYTTTSAGTLLTLESSEAGATAGPVLTLYRNSATPAASDIIGQVLFNGEDSAGNTQEYASIEAVIADPTSTSEDAALDVYAPIAGSRTRYLGIGRNAAGTATANAIGLPLGQLSFPATNNPSSDANTLDDYEEGTFTPTLAASGATFNYSSQLGSYVKIGQFVSVQILILLAGSGNTLTGNPLTITGLPFTAVASGSNAVAPIFFNTITTSLVSMIGTLAASGTTIAIYGMTGAATGYSALNSNQALANNGSLQLSLMYRASA